MKSITKRVDSNNKHEIQGKMLDCRICYSVEDYSSSFNDFVSPCACKGSMKYVHKSCLKRWRFRGKKIEEIKKCEQCLTFYNIDDEIIPHNIIVKITTVLAIMLIYATSHLILNLFLEVLFILTEDLAYPDTNYVFYFIPNASYETTEKAFSKAFNEKISNSARISFCETGIIISIIYQFIKRCSFLYILNYIFTLWRMTYFKYMIDYIFLCILSAHQNICMLKDISHFIDSLLIFILNYR